MQNLNLIIAFAMVLICFIVYMLEIILYNIYLRDRTDANFTNLKKIIFFRFSYNKLICAMLIVSLLNILFSL